MKTQRHGKTASPYQRHGKTPFRYSAEYQSWRAAIASGRPGAIAAAAEAHARKFAPRPRPQRRAAE